MGQDLLNRRRQVCTTAATIRTHERENILYTAAGSTYYISSSTQQIGPDPKVHILLVQYRYEYIEQPNHITCST